MLDPTIGKVLRRLIAIVVIGAVVSTQTYALAQDAMVQHGHEGEAFGRSISPGRMPSVDASGNVTLFPEAAGAAHGNFQTNQLFGGATGNMSPLMDAYRNGNAAVNNAGNTAYEQLKTSTAPVGDAFAITRGTATLSRPDLLHDPVFGATDSVLSGLDLIAHDFQDCSAQTTFNGTTVQAHLDDIRTCERFNDRSGQCTLTHTYSAGILQATDANTHLESCGQGCLSLWIGEIGNNYWDGDCTVHQLDSTVRVTNADAITSATLEYVKWDDYIDIKANNDLIWHGPADTPLVPGCELRTEWEANPNVDLTPFFKGNAVVNFNMAVTVGVKGEGYARVRINYDPTKVVYASTYGPPECLTKLSAATDGFCTATYNCTDMPTTDAEGCAIFDGVRVCPGDVTTPLPPGYPKLCRSADVNVQCGFWQGAAQCWTDPQGQQHCPVVTGDPAPVDECQNLENQGCGFVSSSCIDGAVGQSGVCYVNEERWDCGGNVTIPTATQQQSYNCTGPVRCQGNECITVETDSNPDFATVVAALQAARMIAMDNDCASADPDTASNCKVFAGKAQTCKKVFGGIVDCCNAMTPGVSLTDYITLILSVGKADAAIMSLSKTSTLRGAWEVLRSPVTKSWSAVTDPLISSWNNIFDGYAGVCHATACWDGVGTVTNGSAVSDGFIHGIEQTIMQNVSGWVKDTFGQQAYDMLFEVTPTGDIVLGGILGTALSWIMTAYTIYQLVMILIKLIWKCTQDEFLLNVNKQLRNCHRVGSYCKSEVFKCIEKRESYCCYSSPLSRILQEQVRLQLGRDFGSAKDPDCGGLSVGDLQAVDWSRVDLSEWTATLAATGHLPDPSTINQTTLTQNNFFQNQTGTRRDAATRTIQRLNGIDGAAVRNEASKNLRMGIR